MKCVSHIHGKCAWYLTTTTTSTTSALSILPSAFLFFSTLLFSKAYNCPTRLGSTRKHLPWIAIVSGKKHQIMQPPRNVTIAKYCMCHKNYSSLLSSLVRLCYSALPYSTLVFATLFSAVFLDATLLYSNLLYANLLYSSHFFSILKLGTPEFFIYSQLTFLWQKMHRFIPHEIHFKRTNQYTLIHWIFQ